MSTKSEASRIELDTSAFVSKRFAKVESKNILFFFVSDFFAAGDVNLLNSLLDAR
jgi:hypothetical protein